MRQPRLRCARRWLATSALVNGALRAAVIAAYPRLAGDTKMYASTRVPDDRDNVAAICDRGPIMHSYRYTIALLAFASLFTASTSWAQVAPRTVTGVVRDSTGRPLENAVIALDPLGAIRATRAD